jgi:UDP-N-acetyl-D-mannosaminuronic acid transferase (WecB/TagA/CpsF family)
MALGATVDFVAGTVKRCPVFLQRMGLEWFWRFCHEPRRLFHRYFIRDLQFFWYFEKQLIGIYKNPFEYDKHDEKV